MYRIFLLSPAHAAGRRAKMLFSPAARFELARALQQGESRPLGEIFQFLSGLYFRGKLAYAQAFARPPPGAPGALVITSNRGLVPVDVPTTLEDLRKFATVAIAADEPRFLSPLRRTAKLLAKHDDVDLILLGSISTSRYVDPLLAIFGPRLLFPTDFVGRGDMSRGGLLLRSVRDGCELPCASIAGAVRRGSRPPRLKPVSWRGTPWSGS